MAFEAFDSLLSLKASSDAPGTSEACEKLIDTIYEDLFQLTDRWLAFSLSHPIMPDDKQQFDKAVEQLHDLRFKASERLRGRAGGAI